MTDPYAAAWLSELWPVVREYREPRSKQPKVTTQAPRQPREPCPLCEGRYLPHRLAGHVIRAHPEAVEIRTGNGEEVAS